MKKIIFLPPIMLGGVSTGVYRVFAVDSHEFITEYLQTASREKAILHLETLKQKYSREEVHC